VAPFGGHDFLIVMLRALAAQALAQRVRSIQFEVTR